MVDIADDTCDAVITDANGLLELATLAFDALLEFPLPNRPLMKLENDGVLLTVFGIDCAPLDDVLFTTVCAPVGEVKI